MTERTQEWWERLREPFPPGVVGKLPRVSCWDCQQATKKAQRTRDKHCEKHEITQCKVCGSYITTAHIHLDYVGHAATTSRLLEVDPEWTWRPMATEVDSGFPKFDANGGLWILLTIHGVTRPGYGDGATPKVVIGDAIRNAAMRFGVALDLWAKEDLQHTEESAAAPAVSNTTAVAPPAVPTAAAPSAAADEHQRAHEAKSTLDVKDPDRRLISPAQRKRLFTIAREQYKLSDDTIRTVVESLIGSRSTSDIQRYQYDQVLADLKLAADSIPA
jgi:hypothetical protein